MNTAAAERALEREAIISAAGLVAGRRCLQGEPGWRRVRSRAEIKAYHEAAHAVVALALDKTPWLATIVGVPGVNDGYVLFRPPHSESDPWGGARKSPHDAEVVREKVRALSLTGRKPLAIIRALRAETGRLLEEHWALVVLLAGELLKRQTLSRDEISAILGRHLKSSISAAG